MLRPLPTSVQSNSFVAPPPLFIRNASAIGTEDQTIKRKKQRKRMPSSIALSKCLFYFQGIWKALEIWIENEEGGGG